MLALTRYDGQVVDVFDREGNALRLRVYDFRTGPGGRPGCTISFDDPPRHFRIDRPDRRRVPPPGPDPLP